MLHTLDGNAEAFRLRRINEIKTEVIAERNIHLKLLKKYKHILNVLDAIDAGLITASVGLGITSVGVLSTVIMAPLVIGIGVVSGILGISNISLKFAIRKLRKTVKKYNDIRILADNIINEMSILISTILDDDIISENDFNLIVNLFTKYNDCKVKLATNNKHIEPSLTSELNSYIEKMK